ncbi:MAG TPA: CHAD domain-containing protein [Burkholderiales bacterium]|nr:CHAD domain-containing protein [Burkholderiales bacterium]
MSEEIEIKMSVPEERALHLWEVLAHHPHDKPVTHRLFSAYYDTPERALKAAGAALRLRHQGGRWIQTVKSDGHAAGGLHRRVEHEFEVAAQLPSFPAMADAGLDELVADRQLREALTVAFTTEVNRTSSLLRPAAGKVVEVSLDRGVISAGDRREPICEIELELKSGTPGCLFDLALEIAAVLPVGLDNRSKAERGYALAENSKPAPVKAAPAAVTAQMTVQEAFVALVTQCLAHMQANEGGLLRGRDPEYLHQARVGLRRLRSVFRVFGAAVPREPFAVLLEQLKALGQTLGSARDWDVFVTEMMMRSAHEVADHPGIANLRKRAQVARRRTGQAARNAVAVPAHTGMLLRLSSTLYDGSWRGDGTRTAAALPQFAAAELARQHSRVVKRGRGIEQLAFQDLHRLRIAVKRLRYLAEFFLPLAPKKKARNYIRALSELQDLLGSLNDNAVAWRLLDTLSGEAASPSYQQAVGYVRGWSAAESERCRKELPEAWKHFMKTQPWWARN